MNTERFVARILVAGAVLGMGTSSLADSIDCGDNLTYQVDESSSDDTCSPSATVAMRKARHNLELLILGLEGASCLNQDCTSTSCTIAVVFVDNITTVAYHDPVTGCWHGIASTQGDIKINCSTCDHI